MSEETSGKPPQCTIRAGSRQGSKHVRLNLNNQDAHVSQSFSIPAFNRNYHVGLVSDGCSGQPSFSHSEVGAHLMSLYAYRRIQELICAGVSMEHIPMVLYPSITEFLLDIMTKVMPPNVVWKYPVAVKDREGWNGQTRFRTDYLSATLLGFITDGTSLTTFSAGDGVTLVNDELNSIDQDDHPDYPSISVNKPGVGFDVRTYPVAEVRRVAIATDGLKVLLTNDEFREKVFSFNRDKILGLQTLLNITYNERPEFMQDDCTAVTLEIGEPRKD